MNVVEPKERMEKKDPPPDGDPTNARERALANRETWILARERAAGDLDVAMRRREEIVQLREQLAHSWEDRERLLLEMRQANEQLVLATVRADYQAGEAIAARNAETDGRRRAEALAGKLETSEVALRTSNRAKDEFLAMLGHELRNPLSPIVMVLDIMALKNPSAFPKEREVIARQVRHLTRLVDDLLDVSRIAQGKIELHREPTEISEVVASAVEMVSTLLEEKRHHLTVDVPPRGLLVEADPSRLGQVVNNLLTNAVKYTPPEGAIFVTGRRDDSTVTLSVRDSGIGISPQMLPRVFDLFAQERQALDRSRGGLGLGLAIVQNLVEMHGGTVTARSEGVGRGSEFMIALPAATRAPALVERPGFSGGSAHLDRRLKILLVDDNADSLAAMATVLGLAGHAVNTADDGPAALALVSAGYTPDIAFLDIGLPGMNGYELAQALRAELPARTPLVALTGYGADVDRRRSEQAGFARHLVKPITHDVLIGCMRDTLPPHEPAPT